MSNMGDAPAQPGNSEPEQPPIPGLTGDISRRDFLDRVVVGGGLFLTGVAAGSSVVGLLWATSEDDPSIISSSERLQDGGEYETPIGLIRVEGWRIVHVDPPEPTEDSPVAQSSMESDNSIGWYVHPSTDQAPHSSTSSGAINTFELLPPSSGGTLFTVSRVENGDNISEEYRLELTSFSDEESLPGGLVAEKQLPEDKIKELQDLEGGFRRYQAAPRVFVTAPPIDTDRDVPFGHYDRDRNALVISTHNYEGERQHEQAWGVSYYFERARSTFEGIKNYDNNIVEMYEAFFGPVDGVSDAPEQDARSEKPLHINDYMGVEFQNPYLDEEEFFASALTVMRFFPDELIDRFNAADTATQTVIRSQVELVVRMMREQIHEESQDSVLRSILPNIDSISAALSTT